ncbi:MAG: hypothetical protein J7K88_06405 [Candidatus Fermentibacteraceae bacterium]|nr:hypothetical protein [Candidatus Fermentibacteraceae bacterium]
MRISTSSLVTIIVFIHGMFSVVKAGAPPENSIPIIADRPNFNTVNLELFLQLSWHYFNVLQAGDQTAEQIFNELLPPANQTGMFLCIAPVPIQKWGHWPGTFTGRFSENAFSGSTAYGRPVWYGITYGGTTFQKDTVLEYFSAIEFKDSLEKNVQIMDSLFGAENQVWFYNTFDEGPNRQWNHMMHDSVYNPSTGDSVATYIDDFIPNMFTQALGQDSLPSLEKIDPEGVFSWLKYEVEHGDTAHTVVSVFGLFHNFDWCGHQIRYGTFTDQVNAIRAYLNMEYQGFGTPTLPLKVQNRPQFFIWDCYPYRLVGTNWLSYHSSYQNQVCGWQDTLLLAHFEEGMDSTFITVRDVAIEQERDIPVYYYPQTIGTCGGDVMWEITQPLAPDTLISYWTYSGRFPTPQEFLLNCNLGLIRGTVALFPYCTRSYTGTTSQGESYYTAGYLDNNNMPFDAPYEEWVYTDRWRSDYAVIPPDSFPPFSDSCRVCGDFDPLWDLPERPTTTGDRLTEDYLMWKFSAYARRWNSFRDTFGQIAAVAPELTQLHWWQGHENCLVISLGSGIYRYLQPHVRFFSDNYENPYAFYINRDCYYSASPVKITAFADSLPYEVGFISKILDHSRRFLIPIEQNMDNDFWTFRDTLDAGQGRLVQFFDGSLPADIRITQPDISASGGGILNTHEYRFSVETAITINATFFNMGTVSASDVIVMLKDSTTNSVLATDTVSFSGLSGAYQCDKQTASFFWQPDSDDIGIHILKVVAGAISGEPDTNDNSTQVVFQIIPRDYAKTVLNNPWDMTEASGAAPPAWHTNDLISVSGWNSTFTDSISGMFEGTIPDPSRFNKIELNLSSGSANYIPTRLYDQFSMIAKAEHELTVTVHWQYKNLREQSLVLGTTIDSDWGELGPIDLNSGSSGWASEDVRRLWLEFSGTNLDTDVRIGWIKLTE